MLKIGRNQTIIIIHVVVVLSLLIIIPIFVYFLIRITKAKMRDFYEKQRSEEAEVGSDNKIV